MAEPNNDEAPEPVNPNKKRLKRRAYEFKLSRKVDSPELAYEYWQEVIRSAAWFHENKERLVVLLLNTRHNIDGHSLVSIGTLNESLAHPREIFAGQ
jgi:DNA repair protein RadC